MLLLMLLLDARAEIMHGCYAAGVVGLLLRAEFPCRQLGLLSCKLVMPVWQRAPELWLVLLLQCRTSLRVVDSLRSR